MKPIIPRTTGDGILLELLVEFFHKSILKANTSVVRRKIYRRNRRVIAEIDVLLEGDGEQFAIECRDRGKPQGLPWIQQIIGKRELLRSYGITQWFALSASGFTEDAVDLARTAGIELLVPGEVAPKNADVPGLHHLLKFAVRLANWDFAEPLTATIKHDDDVTLNRIGQELAARSWSAVEIGSTPDELRPIDEFVNEAVQPLIEAEETANGSRDYSKMVQLTFEDVHAAVSGTTFQITSLEISVTLNGTTVQPDFRILTFVSPVTRRVLGIMALNTFKHQGKRLHMMVHLKPGWPQQLSASIKDDRGRPVPGVAILLPASLLTPRGPAPPSA